MLSPLCLCSAANLRHFAPNRRPTLSDAPGVRLHAAVHKWRSRSAHKRRVRRGVSIGEHEQVFAERIAGGPVPHHTVESFENLAHVGGSGGEEMRVAGPMPKSAALHSVNQSP